MPACSTLNAYEESASVSGSESRSESETEEESIPSFTDEDLVLPAEAALTDDVKAAIVEDFTTVGLFESEPRWADVDLESVTIGLPIAYYYLDVDESGSYRCESGEVYQLYPVYIDGQLDCLTQYSKVFGVEGIVVDNDGEPGNDHFKVLFERLKEGTAGKVAVVLARDGAYLFDGSAFELVSSQGIPDLGGSVDEDYSGPQWRSASLADADLPDELIAGIRLTDTSITEPIL